MTGCLKIKNNTYYVVLNLKEDGKYKQKWITTKLNVKGNKRKAEDCLKKLIMEYESKESNSKSSDIQFSDHLKNWLEKRKNKVDIITYEGYRTQVNKHIIPYFSQKQLKLSQIKPSHIAEYYEEKFTDGRCDGKGGLSTRTIKIQSFIIKSALDEAVIYELLLRNPADKVPLPKKEHDADNRVFLDVESANKVLQMFKGHPLQPLVYITLYYGLRRSEVLGLKWSAIDFNNNTIQIRHTVVKNLSIVSKDKTKTSSSKRTYVLLPEIKDLLLNLYSEQKNNKKLFGNSYNDSDYIFTWPDGRLFRPDYVTRGFQRVLKKNGFSKMRFHDLRHSCASILYDKNWHLKDTQTWLGHSSVKTTGDIYTHISQSRKNNMAIDIQNTFSL